MTNENVEWRLYGGVYVGVVFDKHNNAYVYDPEAVQALYSTFEEASAAAELANKED